MATLVALVTLIEPIGFLRVEKGQKFEVRDSAEVDLFTAQGLGALPPDESAADNEDGEASKSDGAPVWTKKIPPKEYLEKYPSGPAAELARTILAAEAAAAAGASTSEES